MSSTVTSVGTFTVFEIAPLRNGCTAAIMLTWPMWWIARSPTATSKTDRCSPLKPGAPTTVLCSFTWATIWSISCGA